MPTLSPVAVSALAYMVGWKSATENTTAVAVARQESGLSTTRSNSCCVGLWQVNLKAHGETKERMVKPDLNAQKAHQIYRSAGGWCTRGKPPNCNPWQAYGVDQPGKSWQSSLNVGAKAYAELARRMATGEKPEDIYGKSVASGLIDGVMDSDVPSPGDAAAAIAGTGKAFVEFMNRIGSWIGDPDNWTRVLKVAGGVVVIVVGGAIVAKDPVIGGAVKALPVGKAAKIIKKVS